MTAEKTKKKVEEEKGDKNDFKNLLNDHFGNMPKPGDLVVGKVISIDRREARLDIAGVLIGVVRGQELFAESREYSDLKIGAEVESTVLELENENGEMELSFRLAGSQRVWDKMRKLMKDGLAIKAKITAANKGGLLMQVDAVPGFMPVSQLSPDNYPRVAGGDKNRILEKLREMINKEIEVKVIDVDEREEKLIVSERAVWEDSQKAVLEQYKVGDIVDGEVSALTSFGAFIKFGEGLEGLVHISEIAWQRIDHPRDILKAGDQIKAQIIQLDRSKIYLSIKRTQDDPWKKVKEKYHVGDKVKGKIVKVEQFGLMVALDKEIHGLAHISELADEPIANIMDKFKVGQEAEFEVVSLEPTEHRLGLKTAGVKGKAGRKAEKVEKVEKIKTVEKEADEEKSEKKEKKAKKAKDEEKSEKKD
ncbi:MAG: S1 RNA-binding domain-containing protein [Candidatus Magasanikbacteria bacterium]